MHDALDAVAEFCLIFLELGDAGDVGKGHQHPVHPLVRGAVGQDSHQVMGLAVAAHDPALAALAAAEHRFDLVPQVEIGNLADDVGQRPAAVAIHEVEDVLDRRREAADHQPLVEKDDRDLGALEQVAQIVVGAVELLDVALQLVVDGVQLLVDGLQLLARSLQLLIGRLHLLVDRDEFLVG